VGRIETFLRFEGLEPLAELLVIQLWKIVRRESPRNNTAAISHPPYLLRKSVRGTCRITYHEHFLFRAKERQIRR
jgi:hypothetical protein